MDNPANTTHLILDLRDRMARIETKLDGHHEAHTVIDKRLEDIEARHEALDVRVSTNAAEIAAAKVRFATLSAIAAGVFSVLGLIGEHLWTFVSGH